jgi:hypothetical protein
VRGFDSFGRAGLLLALCVCSVPSQSVLASEVKGQLVMGAVRPRPAAKSPRPAFNWELENGVKEVLPERTSPRELAIVLLGSAAPSGDGRVEVSISGGTLLPATLVVRSGATVRIRNDDEIGHELFAPGLDGFSAEATSPGATRSVHLTKAGSWPLQDKLAVHASAHLHVLANLVAVARIEANGSYTFSDVPPGKYTLKVLRGADELLSKDVEVTDRPLTVEPLTPLTQ